MDFLSEPTLSSLFLMGTLGLRKPDSAYAEAFRGIFRLLRPKMTFSSLFNHIHTPLIRNHLLLFLLLLGLLKLIEYHEFLFVLLEGLGLPDVLEEVRCQLQQPRWIDFGGIAHHQPLRYNHDAHITPYTARRLRCR